MQSCVTDPLGLENACDQTDRESVVVHVALAELACHAGRRGFESRRSRFSRLDWNDRADSDNAACRSFRLAIVASCVFVIRVAAALSGLRAGAVSWASLRRDRAGADEVLGEGEGNEDPELWR